MDRWNESNNKSPTKIPPANLDPSAPNELYHRKDIVPANSQNLNQGLITNQESLPEDLTTIDINPNISILEDLSPNEIYRLCNDFLHSFNGTVFDDLPQPPQPLQEPQPTQPSQPPKPLQPMQQPHPPQPPQPPQPPHPPQPLQPLQEQQPTQPTQPLQPTQQPHPPQPPQPPHPPQPLQPPHPPQPPQPMQPQHPPQPLQPTQPTQPTHPTQPQINSPPISPVPNTPAPNTPEPNSSELNSPAPISPAPILSLPPLTSTPLISRRRPISPPPSPIYPPPPPITPPLPPITPPPPHPQPLIGRSPKVRKQYHGNKDLIVNACDKDKCRHTCHKNISLERRHQLHDEFWLSSGDLIYRQNWICLHVIPYTPKTKAKYPRGNNKNQYKEYHFRDADGIDHVVCQKFFTHTLGISFKNVGIINNALNAKVDDKSIIIGHDPRGHHEPHNKIDKSFIHNHIVTYDPQHSHYQRKKCPNRRYIEGGDGRTIRTVYEEFLLDNPNFCSYETFRRYFRSQNLSITILGNECCSTCLSHQMHLEQTQCDENIENCKKCREQKHHIDRVKAARSEYRKDSLTKSSDKHVYAVDLQKIKQIPQMPNLVADVHGSKLSCFNESFSQLGRGGRHLAVMWNESISGKKCEDIAATFFKFFQFVEDGSPIVLWLDNCAAQVIFIYLFKVNLKKNK